MPSASKGSFYYRFGAKFGDTDKKVVKLEPDLLVEVFGVL